MVKNPARAASAIGVPVPGPVTTRRIGCQRNRGGTQKVTRHTAPRLRRNHGTSEAVAAMMMAAALPRGIPKERYAR